MGSECKKCKKPNLFAKIFKSQQVKEKLGDSSVNSRAECDLVENTHLSEEFEVLAIEQKELA